MQDERARDGEGFVTWTDVKRDDDDFWLRPISSYFENFNMSKIASRSGTAMGRTARAEVKT